MAENIISGSDTIRLNLIINAFKGGMRAGTINPGSQVAPWLVNGLRWMEEGRTLSVEDIARLDSMGGTDHPDPWFK